MGCLTAERATVKSLNEGGSPGLAGGEVLNRVDVESEQPEFYLHDVLVDGCWIIDKSRRSLRE